MHPQPLASTLWSTAGCDPSQLDRLRFSNTASQLPSGFAVGALAAATTGVQALAAASIWQQRGGRQQTVDIDQRHALTLFRSERYLRVDGQPPAEPRSPVTGYYQAGDGRWLQLHTNFPHHLDGVLRVLQCENTREAVAAAITGWKAAELDTRLAETGMCAAMIRSPAEWQAHPQSQAIAALPLFELDRIGNAAPDTLGGAVPERPLSGVRVLDLSRVIAAPVAARTLAQHGADVLAVSAAHLPNLPSLLLDTGRGKRATQIDLRVPAGRALLGELIRGADVFLHAYRPGALAALGFSSEELHRLNPGLVEVSLSAYSHAGPWAERRGFDSLVQSATGIAWEEGRAAGSDAPGKLPCQALDHATGYLAAFLAMVALQRRLVEGGGWRARVSLAQTGHWLQLLPRVADGLQQPELTQEETRMSMQDMRSPYGVISAVAPVEVMSATPPRFDLPPVPLDTHEAVWL